MPNSRWTLMLATLLSGVLVTTLHAQQLDASSTLARPYAVRDASIGASNGVLHLLSIGGAATGALAGGIFGYAVDQHNCNGPGSTFVPRCAFYGRSATRVGWIGGSVLGATSVSAIIAGWRGCPTGTAFRRALGGAALGALPGAIAGAQNPVRPPRSAFFATAPLLAGFGSALAVMHCTGA